jgi:hypothetical protein
LGDARPDRPPDARAIAKFVFRVVAWAALLYPLWYASSPWLAHPAAWGARIIAETAASLNVASAAQSADRLTFVLRPSAEAVMRGIPADLVAEVTVGTLKYAYGLPFFLALLLASFPRGVAWKAAAGAAIVIASSSVGIACDLLIQAGSTRLANGAQPFLIGAAASEIVAVGYQLGVLIVPTVIPLVLWGAFTTGAVARAQS